MALYYGTNEVKKVFYGTQEVKEVWYGTTKVFSSFVPYTVTYNAQNSDVSNWWYAPYAGTYKIEIWGGSGGPGYDCYDEGAYGSGGSGGNGGYNTTQITVVFNHAIYWTAGRYTSSYGQYGGTTTFHAASPISATGGGPGSNAYCEYYNWWNGSPGTDGSPYNANLEYGYYWGGTGRAGGAVRITRLNV